MKFGELAKYLDKLEKTSSRIEITKILAELFKKANSEEIDKICYLVLGTLAPSYKGLVFNLAERMMLTAIARAYNNDLKNVIKIYKQKGDVGDTVYSLSLGLSSSKTSKFFSVKDVN